MSKHVSRAKRWWTCSQTGRPRTEGGYVWPSGGRWHCLLFKKWGSIYIGSERREREAKIRLERAIDCERKGISYPPPPRTYRAMRLKKAKPGRRT